MTDQEFRDLLARLTAAPLAAFGEQLQRRGGPPSIGWVNGYVTGVEIGLGSRLETLAPAQTRELVLATLNFWLGTLVGTYVGITVDQRGTTADADSKLEAPRRG